MLVHKGHDNTPRWAEGERLHHLFEQRCDELRDAAAVSTGDATFTYGDLDARANQLARYLIARGVKSGDRVALIFDKGVETYVALLAVMKVNAAYLPLDAGFPNDRLEFILEDAGAKCLLSMSMFREKLGALPVETIFLDTEAEPIAAMPKSRLTAEEAGDAQDQLAYIIYTSGTTGKPKGVAVNHASICNFVRVAAEIYGYGPGDRVYQGMTIAFDFSVEELWVPLMAGATLVPTQAGASLVGDDLADFLLKHRITGMCCVPTLLATIEKELPDLRLLLLSGEACPQHLVTRWHRPDRRILNVYGPTEATVTATMTELLPDKPVTIGGPLPTYTIVILDPEKDALVGEGESGEIAIAGIGVAEGYLNRPDLTSAKFIPDFLDIANNPSGRIYRTGDLGRINDDGEVEFQGRIDTQVKVRGYRIELTEIESLLMEFPQVAQAVVNTFEPEPGAVELVAYYSLNKGSDELLPDEMSKVLRSRLPAYMVPAYFEKLAVIPMTTSNKADRKNLPAPKGGRLTGASENYVAPRTETELILAEALARALKIERVSVADDFFRDLGAHSLLMARFCADVRQNGGLSDVSMRDIYMHRTVEGLAAQIDAAGVAETAPEVAREEARVPSNLEYYGCGALQALFYVGFGALSFWTLATGLEWASVAIGSPVELYLRLATFVLLAFVGFTALPIVAKWLIVGRFKAGSFPVWSLRYFRFWMVKALIRSAPIAAFGGTPLYNAYLRLLGAKIGRNVVIRSRFVPVTADLFSVGDDTILNKDSIIVGYKAQSNRIHIGPVRIGANAYLGDASLLDIDTTMEDGAQLGHASSLQRGQRIPAGKRYHGSPAVETTTDFRTVEPMRCSALRRWRYTAFLAVPALLVTPGLLTLVFLLYPYLYSHTSGAEVNVFDPGVPMLKLAAEMAVLAFVLLVVALVAGLLGVVALPRLLKPFLKEDRTYPLYGVHYYIAQIVSGASNSRFFNLLFGDSSFIVHYLTWTGWNLNTIEQTGSNFGTGQKHDFPFLCDIGTGTIVSDGLSMSNAVMSSSSFKLSKVSIGDHNFLGNNIIFPAGARTGANVLLGTKVMVPVDGPVREDVGLLGSPCFEIPRSVEADTGFAVYADESLRKERIRRKNAFNIKTMGYYLLSNWAILSVILFALYVAILQYPQYRSRRTRRPRRSDHACCDPLLCLHRVGEHRIPPPEPQDRLHLRRLFLAARALLEILQLSDPCAVQGHAVQERHLAHDGRQGRPQGVRRRLPLRGEVHGRGWRQRESERSVRSSRAFARRGRLQVGPHRDRQRLHDRSFRLRALWRHDGR